MQFEEITGIISQWALPGLILLLLTAGALKKVPLYETFIDGAKDGVKTVINIIPYLSAIIVVISMLRASGAVEALASFSGGFFDRINFPSELLPLAVVRSLSGSAALGVFTDIVSNNNADSYTAKLAAVIMGCSETTFYVLAVYFGAIGIKKYRYAVITGIFADIAGLIAAVIISRIFFLH